jgi:hypothetical protein
MSITAETLNDLRRRILDHEARVNAGLATADSPPYTIDELRTAIAAIAQSREAIAASPKVARATTSKKIDLGDLL